MQELEYQLPEGSLYYVRNGRGVEITRYQGLAGQVEIPGELPWPEKGIDSGGGEIEIEVMLPVCAISKKAFLSRKYLRTVTVPASVTEVGDWTFAYCDALREVVFLGRQVRFGKDVFKECQNLRSIQFPKAEDREEVGALLAAAVTQMDSPYLLDAQDVGSREWIEKWDARMQAILNLPDDEGYAKQILCGEEDYESADLETYLKRSRKKKVRLLFLRLVYEVELPPTLGDLLKAYLLTHTLGCLSQETWEVVRDEYGDRKEFYQLFAEIGCFTRDNAAAVIAQTKPENPEMRAYFLKYQAEHFTGMDFFGNLEL